MMNFQFKTLRPRPALASSLLASILLLLAVCQASYAEYQPLERIAAIVEDSVILQSEVDERINTIKADLFNNPSPMPPDDILKKQILDQLILESIQLQLAEKNGIRVSDNVLSDTMEKIAAQNGKNLNEFKKSIEDQGLIYKDIREKIRKDLILSRLRQKMVANRINITEQDVKNYLNSPEGKEKLSASYRLGHVLVENEQQAQTLYEQLTKGADFFQIAASYGEPKDLGLRKVEQLPTILTKPAQKLSMGEVAKPIKSASGYHVIQVLEKQGGDYKIVKQTKARHILIKPNEIRTKQNAKQMIDDIRAQIDQGKSFAELARTYSEDPMSASAGGDLGWSVSGDFVPEFEQVMENTEAGTVSEPFYSNFGWHIVEVMERREHNVGKEFQLDQARSILQQQQFEDEIRLWLREIRQSAFVEIKLPGYENEDSQDKT